MAKNYFAVVYNKTAIAVYTTKEDADEFAEIMNKRYQEWTTKISPGSSPISRRIWSAPGHEEKERYTVRELFPDCYLKKLRDGYKSFGIILKKDGTVKEAKETFTNPSLLYGWKSKQVAHDFTINWSMQNKNDKIFSYTGLHKNAEEAIAEANRLRLKSLLDDVWNPEK